MVKVVLLEKIKNLGNIGDQVSVRGGYWRNYLLPRNKAMVANVENLHKMQQIKIAAEQIEKSNLEKALKRADSMKNLVLIIPVKVSEEGTMFGSVGVREITLAASKMNVEIDKHEINLPIGPIKQIGEYEIIVRLHADVHATVRVYVVDEKEGEKKYSNN